MSKTFGPGFSAGPVFRPIAARPKEKPAWRLYESRGIRSYVRYEYEGRTYTRRLVGEFVYAQSWNINTDCLRLTLSCEGYYVQRFVPSLELESMPSHERDALMDKFVRLGRREILNMIVAKDIDEWKSRKS